MRSTRGAEKCARSPRGVDDRSGRTQPCRARSEGIQNWTCFGPRVPALHINKHRLHRCPSKFSEAQTDEGEFDGSRHDDGSNWPSSARRLGSSKAGLSSPALVSEGSFAAGDGPPRTHPAPGVAERGKTKDPLRDDATPPAVRSERHRRSAVLARGHAAEHRTQFWRC